MANSAIFNGVLDEAQNFALNQFIDNIDYIRIGDDNTPPEITDTDVGNLIGSAPVETVDTSVPGEVVFGTKFGITSFVGDTSREAVISDGNIIEGYGRVLTAERLKGADQIFWYRIKVKVTAMNKPTS